MKRVDRMLGRVRRVRHKWFWVTFGVLWVWAATRPPAMVGIERLIDPVLMRVIQVDTQFSLIEYGCKWLVEIDDPLEVERLMNRARQEGTNLATPEFVLDPAREYCPARYRDRFTEDSEIIRMFFLRRKQPGHLYV